VSPEAQVHPRASGDGVDLCWNMAEISLGLLEAIKKRGTYNPECEGIGGRFVGIVVGGGRGGFLESSK